MPDSKAMSKTKSTFRPDAFLFGRYSESCAMIGIPVVENIDADLTALLPIISNTIIDEPQDTTFDGTLVEDRHSSFVKKKVKAAVARSDFVKVNLALPNETLATLTALCKKHDLVRDAVLNRVLLVRLLGSKFWTKSSVYGAMPSQFQAELMLEEFDASSMVNMLRLRKDPMWFVDQLMEHGDGALNGVSYFSHRFPLPYPEKHGSGAELSHLTVWATDIAVPGTVSFPKAEKASKELVDELINLDLDSEDL